jgi:hypothetical protein
VCISPCGFPGIFKTRSLITITSVPQGFTFRGTRHIKSISIDLTKKYMWYIYIELLFITHKTYTLQIYTLTLDSHPNSITATLCSGNEHVVIVSDVPFSCVIQTHMRHDPESQSCKRKIQLAKCKTGNMLVSRPSDSGTHICKEDLLFTKTATATLRKCHHTFLQILIKLALVIYPSLRHKSIRVWKDRFVVMRDSRRHTNGISSR